MRISAAKQPNRTEGKRNNRNFSFALSVSSRFSGNRMKKKFRFFYRRAGARNLVGKMWQKCGIPASHGAVSDRIGNKPKNKRGT